MRRCLLLLLSLMACAVGLHAVMPVELEGLRLYSPSLGREMRFSLVLPHDYAHSPKRYPVVYLLHGIGGDNSTWMEYADIAMLSQRSGVEAVYVMPDGLQSYYCDSYDSSQRYESFLLAELMPYIEREYPVATAAEGRAVIGFSMGGFGAMSLYLRHTDVFSACVALSPSIRTDAQYAVETPQKDWDSQWGRVFGGVGKTGADRLTAYYRKMSPYHILSSLPVDKANGLHLRIDVGDKEQTLLESNEALHTMLLAKGISHEWRVRQGGHDFDCWNAAMPEALDFVFRCLGDSANDTCRMADVGFDSVSVTGCRLFIPRRNVESVRKYPVVYVQEDDGAAWVRRFVDEMGRMASEGLCRQMAVCIVPQGMALDRAVEAVEKRMEKHLRASQRMRAFVGRGDAADRFFKLLPHDNMFTAAILVDALTTLCPDEAAAAVKGSGRYPRCFFSTDADFGAYGISGALHCKFRKMSLSHEFRSMRYSDKSHSTEWREWIMFLDRRFHI